MGKSCLYSLGGPQGRPGRFEEEKHSALLWNQTGVPRFPSPWHGIPSEPSPPAAETDEYKEDELLAVFCIRFRTGVDILVS